MGEHLLRAEPLDYVSIKTAFENRYSERDLGYPRMRDQRCPFRICRACKCVANDMGL